MESVESKIFDSSDVDFDKLDEDIKNSEDSYELYEAFKGQLPIVRFNVEYEDEIEPYDTVLVRLYLPSSIELDTTKTIAAGVNISKNYHAGLAFKFDGVFSLIEFKIPTKSTNISRTLSEYFKLKKKIKDSGSLVGDEVLSFRKNNKQVVFLNEELHRLQLELDKKLEEVKDGYIIQLSAIETTIKDLEESQREIATEIYGVTDKETLIIDQLYSRLFI